VSETGILDGSWRFFIKNDAFYAVNEYFGFPNINQILKPCYFPDILRVSPPAFRNEMEIYLTDIVNGFWVLSHGFRIQFA